MKDEFYLKLHESTAPLKKKIEKLKKSLKSSNKCTHSRTVEYKWDWDDGYGTQKILSGLRCTSCGKRNSWPGMSEYWHD